MTAYPRRHLGLQLPRVARHVLSGGLLAAKAMFGYYAERFRTVEINYTFYRMPTPKMTDGVARRRRRRDFTYALKAPRRITHDPAAARTARTLTQFFCDSARVARRRTWRRCCSSCRRTSGATPPRSTAFLETLPRGPARGVRVPARLLADRRGVSRCCAQHNVALCIADFGDKTTPVATTARHGYFRLRDEGYTPADLERWADSASRRTADWDEVFVYFKHEEKEGAGVRAAFRWTLLLTRSRRGIAPRGTSIAVAPPSSRRAPSAAADEPQCPPCARRCTRDVRIVADAAASPNWSARHERVVLRREDQRRNPRSDRRRAARWPGGSSPGVAEAVMRRRVDVVELANRPDAVERRQVEAPGQARLAPHPRLQVAHEVPLIGEVRAALDRADAALEIDRRADGARRRAAADGQASPSSPASFSARLPPSE